MALLRTGVGSRETLLGVTSFMKRLHLFSEMKGGAGKMAPQVRCLLPANPKFSLHSGRRELTIPGYSLTSTSTP